MQELPSWSQLPQQLSLQTSTEGETADVASQEAQLNVAGSGSFPDLATGQLTGGSQDVEAPAPCEAAVETVSAHNTGAPCLYASERGTYALQRGGFREGRRGRTLTQPPNAIYTETDSAGPKMSPELSGDASPAMHAIKTGEVWSPSEGDAFHDWPSTPEARFVPQMQVPPMHSQQTLREDSSGSPESTTDRRRGPGHHAQQAAYPTLLAGIAGHQAPCMHMVPVMLHQPVMTPVSWVQMPQQQQVQHQTTPAGSCPQMPCSLQVPAPISCSGQQGSTPPSRTPVASVDSAHFPPTYQSPACSVQEASFPTPLHSPPPVGTFSEPLAHFTQLSTPQAGTASEPVPQLSRAGTGSEGLSSQSSSSAPNPQRASPVAPKATSIAQLQELLQSAQRSIHFRYPPGAKVLQWSHSEQRTAEGFASFRAVLAFFQDGVGHHVTGSWERSKKAARQSAADCAFAMLRGKWVPDNINGETFVDLGSVLPVGGTRASGPAAEADVQLLNRAVDERAELRLQGGEVFKPVFKSEETDNGEWTALVNLMVLGVKHTFSGPPRATKEAACAEAARRILWYLRKMNFEGLYVPDASAIAAAECLVPEPPVAWAKAAMVDVRFRQQG